MLIFLFGCTKVVDLGDDFDSKIAVHTQLTPDSTFNILLIKTRPVLENEPADTIKDADVKIFFQNELLTQLTLEDNVTSDKDFPVFRTEQFRPEPNNTYDLVIDLPEPDNIELTAQTTIPDNINLMGIELEQPIEIPNGKIYDSIFIDGVVKIENDLFKDNFFHLAEAVLVIDYLTIDEFGDTSLFTPNAIYRKLDIINKSVDNQSFTTLIHEPGFLVDDVNNAGEETLDVNFRVTTTLTTVEHPSALQLYVRHVDEEYYNYHKRITLQLKNKNNPFAIPVFISSNVKNGVGNFSGYTNEPITGRFN